MAARTPTITTTIITSSNVNPRVRFRAMQVSPFDDPECKALNFRYLTRATDGQTAATGVGGAVAETPAGRITHAPLCSTGHPVGPAAISATIAVSGRNPRRTRGRLHGGQGSKGGIVAGRFPRSAGVDR